jgi:hypothetical protein
MEGLVGLATDIRYTVATLFRRVPKPNMASRRIYAYADKVHKSTGGAPDKLVAMYRTHARHRE